MIFALEKHLLPLGATLPQNSRKIAGGYFIWISLPEPLQAREVAARAERDQQLIIMPGYNFAVWGDDSIVDLERNVRLTFSWEEEDKLIEGIERLGVVVKEMQREHDASQG